MSVLSVEINKQLQFQPLPIKKMLSLPSLWRERSIMRHKLGQLPAYRLEDMGIDSEEALVESQKPFWKK